MRRTLATLGGLCLAVLFSQFPEYAQQYEQRLGGAVNELRIIVADFDADAQRFGLSRPQALQRYSASPDGFIIARGTNMQRTLARYDALRTALEDLQGANAWQRVIHLSDYLDEQISAQALAAFKPAVPVSAEGLTWAITGLALGYLAVSAFLGFLTLPLRWRRGQQPHHRVPRPRFAREPVPATVRPEVEAARRDIRRQLEPDRQA